MATTAVETKASHLLETNRLKAEKQAHPEQFVDKLIKKMKELNIKELGFGISSVQPKFGDISFATFSHAETKPLPSRVNSKGSDDELPQAESEEKKPLVIPYIVSQGILTNPEKVTTDASQISHQYTDLSITESTISNIKSVEIPKETTKPDVNDESVSLQNSPKIVIESHRTKAEYQKPILITDAKFQSEPMLQLKENPDIKLELTDTANLKLPLNSSTSHETTAKSPVLGEQAKQSVQEITAKVTKDSVVEIKAEEKVVTTKTFFPANELEYSITKSSTRSHDVNPSITKEAPSQFQQQQQASVTQIPQSVVIQGAVGAPEKNALNMSLDQEQGSFRFMLDQGAARSNNTMSPKETKDAGSFAQALQAKIENMKELAQQVKNAALKGDTDVTLHLKPDYGSVKASIHITDNNVTMHMIASSKEAADLLAQHRQDFEQIFAESNLNFGNNSMTFQHDGERWTQSSSQPYKGKTELAAIPTDTTRTYTPTTGINILA